jgi:hypothetical protein
MGRTSRDAHKVLVVGLPAASTTDDLLKLVKPYGNALEAAHAVDAAGKPRGFAFVRFGDSDAAQAAIAGLDKTDLHGRTLHVRAVEERGVKEPASSAKGRPCFDFAKGKCARGAACKWAHVKPEEGSAASRRPDWQKTRPDAGAGAAPSELFSADMPEDYCRKYQLGKCHRGPGCRWQHVLWKPPPRPQAKEADETEASSGARERKKPRVADVPAASEDTRARGVQEIGLTSHSQPSAVAVLKALGVALAGKEAAWREAHPEVSSGEAVPDEAKRRDVVWRAMERMRARAGATTGM